MLSKGMVMQCPNCHTQLVMTDRQGVEIDYCPTCRGVWLDRGELDKIIERASGNSHEHREPEYRRHDDDDYDERRYREQRHDNHYDGHHKKHKKESFLGDLFDF